MAADKIVIDIGKDGALKVDASQAQGDEAELLASLELLAEMTTGNPKALKVEAHRPGRKHAHTHTRGTVKHSH